MNHKRNRSETLGGQQLEPAGKDVPLSYRLSLDILTFDLLTGGGLQPISSRHLLHHLSHGHWPYKGWLDPAVPPRTSKMIRTLLLLGCCLLASATSGPVDQQEAPLQGVEGVKKVALLVNVLSDLVLDEICTFVQVGGPGCRLRTRCWRTCGTSSRPSSPDWQVNQCRGRLFYDMDTFFLFVHIKKIYLCHLSQTNTSLLHEGHESRLRVMELREEEQRKQVQEVVWQYTGQLHKWKYWFILRNTLTCTRFHSTELEARLNAGDLEGQNQRLQQLQRDSRGNDQKKKRITGWGLEVLHSCAQSLLSTKTELKMILMAQEGKLDHLQLDLQALELADQGKENSLFLCHSVGSSFGLKVTILIRSGGQTQYHQHPGRAAERHCGPNPTADQRCTTSHVEPMKVQHLSFHH